MARQAQDEYHAAQRRYFAALKEALPPGTRVQFSRRERWEEGSVLDVSNSNVKVRNLRTQREYWIGAGYLKGLSA